MHLLWYMNIGLAMSLFVGMVLLQEVGFRIGRAARAPENFWTAASLIEAAVFGLLGLLLAFQFSGALLSAVLSGFATSAANRRSWLHKLVFAAVVAITVFVILDLEYPRIGLIRIGAADQAMVQARQAMD